LSEDIEDYDDLKSSLVPQFESFVNPELTSKFSLLRTAACWLYNKFDFLEFTGQVKEAAQGIFNNMFHSSLPVKLQAGITIGKLAFDNEIVRDS
jgi:hypothetical protein